MRTNTGLEFYSTRNGGKKINDTGYISERAFTTTIMVNHQRIKLMSVYFPHSVYADHHIE